MCRKNLLKEYVNAQFWFRFTALLPYLPRTSFTGCRSPKASPMQEGQSPKFSKIEVVCKDRLNKIGNVYNYIIRQAFTHVTAQRY